jgi:hypothetical protein
MRSVAMRLPWEAFLPTVVEVLPRPDGSSPWDDRWYKFHVMLCEGWWP